tara:strand:- start:343 stop:765 length:423 start_codon:yes stop_codon:yes gene_type:complete
VNAAPELSLEDRQALQDVMQRYAAAVDDRDLTAYAELFTEDVGVHGFADDVIEGRDAWVAFVTRALERFGATQHLLAPQLARATAAGAHCRTDFQATHELADRPERLFVLWACYETDLVRTPNGWRIHRHELVRRAERTW